MSTVPPEIREFPDRSDIRKAPKGRNIVIEEDGKWRMRVPLMRKWLMERA